MGASKVSVIIPTYNGRAYLGAAIESVLGQTYPNLEVIVVDDASPDATAEIVRRFDDARVRYIAHPTNRGSDVARDTGLRDAAGEIIAFLDQDDRFHPEKLATHIALLGRRADVGATYNNRFELNHSAETVRDIWRPPHEVTLGDLVLGFPIAPSDIVLRREWAMKMDLLGGSLSWCGGEIVHFGRLFMDGCKFLGVDRALNYRRHHAGRITRDLVGGCMAEIGAQDKILADPRCPPQVRALHNRAHSNIYLIWAYRALTQGETAAGQDFLREAVRLTPYLLSGAPCELASFMLTCSVDDIHQDHEAILEQLISQLPPEVPQVSEQLRRFVSRGYAIKCVRACLWLEPADGYPYMQRAIERGLQVDDSLVQQLASLIGSYHHEIGASSAQLKRELLLSMFAKFGRGADAARVIASYLISRAFHAFQAGEYDQARRLAVSAVSREPRYLANRGVLSMIARSYVGGFGKLSGARPLQP